MTVVVIGAGFGGLAAAIRCAARGESVRVIERLPGPGGRGREFCKDQGQSILRYDAGPTVLTAPVLFEELFALLGENISDHVELLPVSPWYQMRFSDGSVLNYGGSNEDIQAEIAKFSEDDANAYPLFFEHSRALFEKGYEELGTEPFLGAMSMLKALPAMIKLRADRSVYQNTAKFFSDERIRRAFSIQPLLVGGNPFDTTSIYSLIHYLERRWGVWFPRGGMARLVDSLVALARRHGVQFDWNAEVQTITVNGTSVNGVQLSDGSHIPADTVISNADAGYTLAKLLPAANRISGAITKKQYSMGLFVWYFTTSRIYNDVCHHTILFGEKYREALHNIFEAKVINTDLSIYLHRPTATDPKYAPSGYDSFYALVPVPNLSAMTNWEMQAEPLKALLLRELSRRILPGLESCIVDEHVVTPEYFASELAAPFGSGFSITPKLTQSAGFRFPNRAKDFSNLYFVGAGTHPGAGVPGVVTSAKVVERLMFGSVQ